MISDHEDCTICLEVLFPHAESTISRLQPCGHHYHTECIHVWKEKSNTCPTCRHDYEIIELINFKSEVVSRTQATKIEVPVVEEFFEENLEIQDVYVDEDSSRLDQRLDFMLSNSNTCVLCDDPVTTNANALTSCVGCSSCFHVNCLGLSTLNYWCCPLCDADNVNYSQTRISQFRRSRNSARTNRVYNSNRRNLTEIIQKANEAQQLQQEQEQLEREVYVSPEIEQSWNVFEVARKDIVERNIPGSTTPANQPSTTGATNNTESTSTASANCGTTEARKLKQPLRRNRQKQGSSSSSFGMAPMAATAPATATVPVPSIGSSSSTRPSVVSSILNQMKANRNKPPKNTFSPTSEFFHPLPHSNTHEGWSVTSSSSSSFHVNSLPPTAKSSTDSLPNYSPDSCANTTIHDNDPPSNKYWKEVSPPMPTNITNNALTFQQKQSLRNIVRDLLKPYYSSKQISEDQYTDINRKISHSLYGISITKGHLINEEEALRISKETIRSLGLQ